MRAANLQQHAQDDSPAVRRGLLEKPVGPPMIEVRKGDGERNDRD